MDDLCETFRLLGDVTRLKILIMLAAGERDVTSMVAELAVSQPTASHHLGILRRGGLVNSLVRGKSRVYSLAGAVGRSPAGFEIETKNHRIEFLAK